MSLNLALDDVTLYPPSFDTDAHGWREPGEVAAWEGRGNLQLQPGISNPRGADGGGRGPFGPARDNLGQLFLPPDAPLLEGSVAQVRGRRYVLSQTRIVLDPTGSGGLDCWASTATSIDTWPNPAPPAEPGAFGPGFADDFQVGAP